MQVKNPTNIMLSPLHTSFISAMADSFSNAVLAGPGGYGPFQLYKISRVGNKPCLFTHKCKTMVHMIHYDIVFSAETSCKQMLTLPCKDNASVSSCCSGHESQ